MRARWSRKGAYSYQQRAVFAESSRFELQPLRIDGKIEYIKALAVLRISGFKPDRGIILSAMEAIASFELLTGHIHEYQREGDSGSDILIDFTHSDTILRESE